MHPNPPPTKKLKKEPATKKLKKEQEEPEKNRANRSKDTPGSSGPTLKKTKSDQRIKTQPFADAGAGATVPKNTLVTQGQRQDVVTRTGGLTKAATGLASDDMAQWYRDEVIKVEGEWDELSPRQRIQALLAPANAALQKFGVPPVSAKPITALWKAVLGVGDDPSFGRGSWEVSFGEVSADFEPSHPQFHQKFTVVAGSIYHEARHAEQVFRVARKLAAEQKKKTPKKTPEEIGREIAPMLGITEGVAQAAAKVPLSDKQKDEWAQAEAWQLNLEKKDGNQARVDDVNTRMVAAKNEYEKAQEDWENYQYTLTGDPKVTPEFKQLHDDTIAQDGPEKWAQRGEDWRLKYIQARELFRQWYTFYAQMPVEEDAWAVGGQVEYLLTGKAVTKEDVLADLSPDERTMTPVELLEQHRLIAAFSDQEHQILEAFLQQPGSESNLPPMPFRSA